MSTGWPPFRYHFSTTLQSGTVFHTKKVYKKLMGTRRGGLKKVEPLRLGFTWLNVNRELSKMMMNSGMSQSF